MVAGHTRKGGFDTLRLIAALMVFHSHSFAIVGRAEPKLPGFTWGGVAVLMFFVMSGYWVTRSALERSLTSYATARALRIVPGLFVCCLVTIGLCALATSAPVNDYLRDPQTWRWLRNAVPFWLPQAGQLPRVFEDGAISNPNGSLWTLPYEVFCYVLVAIAASFGPKGVRAAMIATAIFAAVVLFGGQGDQLYRIAGGIYRQPIAFYAAAFFFGAALNQATDRRLAGLFLTSALAMALSWRDPVVSQILGIFLYGSAVIWIGRNVDLDRWVTRGRDISYGVYIYAFPLEQLAARAIWPASEVAFLAYYGAALAGTVALAALSWVLVEKPAIDAKGRVTGLIERAVGRLPLRAMRAVPASKAGVKVR